MKELFLTNLNYIEKEDNKNILFLGDWVKDNSLFEKKKNLQSNNIFDSGIFNKEKISQIYKSNDKFRIKVFNALARQINKFHNLNYENNFWKIILEPWYTDFFETVLFRYIIIEKLMEHDENLSCNFYNFLNQPQHFDWNHFIMDVCYDDFYNQYLFQRLIIFLNRKKKIKINYTNDHKFLYESKKIASKNKLFNFLNIKILRTKKYYIDLNIGIKNYILLNFFLKQLPYKDKILFSENNNNIFFNDMSSQDKNLRQKIDIGIKPETYFETFFIELISSQIPITFLEDYKKIQNYIEKYLDFSPKKIISDKKYATNTIFKFWMAKSYAQGSKIITTDHGGYYGVKTANEEVRSISNKIFTYSKTNDENKIHVPIVHKLSKREKKLSKLLVITHGVCKYPHYVTTYPVSGQALDQIELVKNFYNTIPKKIYSNFYIRPYQGQGWNLNERYKKIFDPAKILIEKKKYEEVFKISKLVISTYPKTSFYESFLSGPSILLTNLDHFKINKEFDELHGVLKRNKMLFEDSFEASSFVLSIWDNVNDWWSSNSTQEALKIFKSYLGYEKKNKIKIWANLIK